MGDWRTPAMRRLRRVSGLGAFASGGRRQESGTFDFPPHESTLEVPDS
jgi:hypothetical protein